MLECIAWNSPDSKTLEHLVWSVYDGILSPGPTLKLMGPESYNQVTRHLASKVFRGLQVHCLMQTLAQFDEPAPVRVRSVIFATPPSDMARKLQATEAMDMTSQKVESAEEGAVGGEASADPNRHPMAWMHDQQKCYDDEMISFWPLLHPLTDGGGTATRHLVHHFLSTWQWSSTTHPVSCPPTPTNMEIGRWLPLDREGSKEDLWIQAYACCLQCIAEAFVRCFCVVEGERMAPHVSPLVQAFLSTMGRHIDPSIVRECWPSKNDIVPRQPTNLVRAHITYCLDKVAMQSPSTITWDMSVWPESNKSFWKEDCLPYSPGSTVDLNTQMPGVWLKLHNWEGNYQGVARVLKYEGHMLVYDPQTNGMGWVAMKGVPSSLMEVEVRSAGNLGNFYPILCTVPEGPKATRSLPEKATVEYEQSKTETPRPTAVNLDEYIDWDTDYVQDRSHTPSPSMVIDEPTQGESMEDTPPTRQNICLVSERIIESGVVPPQEHAPITEDKPQDDSAPSDEEQPKLIVESDIVDLYMSMEDL